MTDCKEYKTSRKTEHYTNHPGQNLHSTKEYDVEEITEGRNKEGGIWEKTKEVSGNIWEKTKEVGSDIWEGTKNLAGDAKNAVTDDDDYLEDDIEINEEIHDYADDKYKHKHNNRDYF